MPRQFAFVLLLFTVTGVVRAQSDPATLPARDHHEGLLIAADPYVDQERSKEKLGKANPLPAGIVAIEVYVRNETTNALRMNLETVRLILSTGEQRQRLEPLYSGDVATLIVHPGGTPRPESKHGNWPRRSVAPSKDKKVRQLEDILRPLELDIDLIPPLSTMHGFLFFNLDHDFNLLRHSSLYVPDVKLVSGNQPLTYFEIDLSAALPH